MIEQTDIRDLRKEAGLTQKELGRRVGIHRHYVGSIENGNVEPAPDTLMALAEELKKALGQEVPPELQLSDEARQDIRARKGRAKK